MDAIFYIYLGMSFILGAGLTAAHMLYRRGILMTMLEERDRANANLALKTHGLSEDLQRSRSEAVRLQAEKDALSQQMLRHKEDLERMEDRFKDRFENLASKIFDEKHAVFKTQSQAGLSQILEPLKEKIKEFQDKIDLSSKEQFSLKNEIGRLVEAHGKITLQAENLASAIKGDSKTQGDWGEIILENILQASGLRKNEDYAAQGEGLGLIHAETGHAQKPDITVNLPENKHIIIDSKVSLTHYERLGSETDAAQRQAHLKRFLESVRNHVKDLERRRYQDSGKLNAPDFVLMFMPIEGAYLTALQEDRALHSDAWAKNVVIVGPTNLLATLRTVSSLWKLIRQNRNALEIAKQGGALYDKIEGFVTDMQSLGRQLKTAETTYEEAMKKLSSGKGNILGRTEKLKHLGAKTSKALPVDLIEMEDGPAMAETSHAAGFADINLEKKRA